MSEVSFPFNSVSGDRRYKAEDFRAYFAQIIGNGVIYASSDALKVKEAGAMQVKVSAGGAWVDGIGYRNTVEKTLTLDTADGALNRIDRIVIRADFTERTVTVEVLKGAYSATPTAPELQRNADRYELGIADVYVGKGVVQIKQENITDTRLSASLCGIVTGVIEQADVTDIFNQFEDYYANFKAQYVGDMESWTKDQQDTITAWEEQQKTEFIAWVDSIHDILDETTAGKLQNEIEEEIARATKAELERFYGMQNATTEFLPNGNIEITNNDGTLLVAKSKLDGVTTITETLTRTGGLSYEKVTTITPATDTTNKIIREEYSTL